MNILYTSDDGFTFPGLISIKSLLETNKMEPDIHIYYIENSISEEHKQDIRDLVEKYYREITFLPMPDLYQYVIGDIHTNIVIYSYFFVQEILPKDIDRILLIECDTMVLKPLNELYNIDFEENFLAGVDDIRSAEYRKAIGMKSDSTYFNSGILLFNLKKMRNDKVTNGLKNLLKSGKGRLFYEAQDELNVFFEKKALIIHPKYNCFAGLFLYDYKNLIRYRTPSTCYSEKEIKEAITDPCIVHFTTSHLIQSRPWIVNCTHPLNDRYIEFKKDTIYADRALVEKKISNRDKLLFWIYKNLPRTMSAMMLGVFHSYLYPIYKRIRGKY